MRTLPFATSRKVVSAFRPSAPKAIALTKSDSVRRPPVAMRGTPFASFLSRCNRARANPAIEGTEMLFLKISGAAPVAPPRPSRMM